jgi:hypothetical protein
MSIGELNNKTRPAMLNQHQSRFTYSEHDYVILNK